MAQVIQVEVRTGTTHTVTWLDTALKTKPGMVRSTPHSILAGCSTRLTYTAAPANKPQASTRRIQQFGA